VVVQAHTDHDTLATFWRRLAKEVETLFLQVRVLAREMKRLKLGQLALDGTKIDTNASKRKALSPSRRRQAPRAPIKMSWLSRAPCKMRVMVTCCGVDSKKSRRCHARTNASEERARAAARGQLTSGLDFSPRLRP
jgi:hypothetical protein